MPAPDRLTRVNEILKREIADLIERKSFRDGACLLSVTGVRVSCDLRSAHIGVSVFGGGKETKKEALNFLRKNRKDIQKSMGKDLTLKYTPVLHFELDSKLEEGDNILQIINNLDEDHSNES